MPAGFGDRLARPVSGDKIGLAHSRGIQCFGYAFGRPYVAMGELMEDDGRGLVGNPIPSIDEPQAHVRFVEKVSKPVVEPADLLQGTSPKRGVGAQKRRIERSAAEIERTLVEEIGREIGVSK